MRHVFILALIALTGKAVADPVGITKEVASVTIEGGEIARIQDNDNEVSGEWARTSRACPPYCIQPMTPADGVSTLGELELIDALQDPGVTVIDSRTPDWFEGGSIPGAINIPYTEMTDHLAEFGCEIDFDGWDCTAAEPVVLFCNGPWCGQSPSAIRRMIEVGFPADKIGYYRGGMQGWRMLGLSVSTAGG
ncbi:MAG: rhodanese-like domain-containing protein [Dinoroseobacter sp.]|nr:rhodanese-like domain-containing protein [Dinoroseobacter sp.]